MRSVAADLEDVVGSDAPAVVEGERGTGREMIARLVHFAGGRRDGAFVAIEAAAAPRPLVDRAAAEPAAEPLRAAAGGTLLIKNLCALEPAAQRQLAAALREPAAARARVIGSCDHDLDAAVEAGVFDAELYEHLTVHRIALPPLRERSEDIPPLATHFVRDYGRQAGRPHMTLSSRAFDALVRYPWPGNVAELKDLARRLVIRAARTRIEAGDVDAALPAVAERVPLEEMSLEEVVRAKLREFLRRMDGYPIDGLYEDVLQRIERPLFDLVMDHTGGNQLRAAEILGLSRNTLRRKLVDHGLVARTLRARDRAAANATPKAAKVARRPRGRDD